MKISIRLIRVGAVINLLIGVLHISFWKLFDWSNQLPKLTVVNSNIMQMLNLFTIVFFGYTTYLLWFQTTELLMTKIGRHFLAMLAILYASRLMMEFYFPQGDNGTAAFLFVSVLVFAFPLFQVRNPSHAH